MVIVAAKGLFAFRSVHHLKTNPREHWSESFWSLDTGIQLFGVKFPMLFACCIFTFIFILMPTFVVLLVPKHLLRFRFITKFLKPFLDVYQAPFKENSYYFLGIELSLRISVYACDSIRADYTAAIYIAFILRYLIYLGYFQPFESSLNDALYLMCMCILGCVTTVVLYFNPEQPKTYVIIFDILIWLILLQFVGIVVVHTCKYDLHQNLTSTQSKICKAQLYLRSVLKLSQRSERVEKAAIGSYEEYQDELLSIDPDIQQ